VQVTDIIALAVAKCGLARTDAVPTHLSALALKLLNKAYQDVWNVYPFRDEKVVGLSVSQAAQAECIFPEYIEAVRSLRNSDGTPIVPISELFLSENAGAAFSDTGSVPSQFYNLPDSPVQTQPPTATALKVLSSSTADTSGTVRVFGTVATLEAYEDFTLNGTTAVTGSLVFSEVKSVSKALTTGRITVAYGSGPTTIATMPPWAYLTAYRRIRLYPVPTAACTLYAECLRQMPRLTSDSDTILLHRAEPAIIDLLVAELYEYDEKPELAQGERAKAADHLKLALNAEEQRDRQDNRSFPASSIFGDDGVWPILDSRYKTF
jgi:hypothetical protein